MSSKLSSKCLRVFTTHHHDEPSTYQKGETMDEGMKWTAEDDGELLDFREYVQVRDFTETLCDAERVEIREWLDADAMERIRNFAAYMESHGHDPEQLMEVIGKVENDPLSLTVYDLLNAGDVLHMVPSVTFHGMDEFWEIVAEAEG